jgi:hypothetical protein
VAFYATKHIKRLEVAYVLKCDMYYVHGLVNHHAEITQKVVHIYNLQENSET